MNAAAASIKHDAVAVTPAVWATAFLKLDVQSRVRVLGPLLGLLGPLALAVVAGGAFVKYVRFARTTVVPISFEDAARATASQVQDLVRYVHQSHPRILRTSAGRRAVRPCP
jgi:hypothetical protein